MKGLQFIGARLLLWSLGINQDLHTMTGNDGKLYEFTTLPQQLDKWKNR